MPPGSAVRALARTTARVPMLRRLISRLRPGSFAGSTDYWERRYAAGGTSGAGSVGPVARWKGTVVSEVVARHGIASVVEWGCGDGTQLQCCEYPRYLGLDVSATAVRTAAARFAGDPSTSFVHYDPQAFHDDARWFAAEAAVSLEVVFHLVEPAVYETYLATLFDSADRLVVVCSSDTDDVPGQGPHERHRAFTPWVSRHRPGWTLLERIDPPPDLPMASSFFVFGRSGQSSRAEATRRAAPPSP